MEGVVDIIACINSLDIEMENLQVVDLDCFIPSISTEFGGVVAISLTLKHEGINNSTASYKNLSNSFSTLEIPFVAGVVTPWTQGHLSVTTAVVSLHEFSQYI